jgi:hypothetical protein
MYHNYQGEACTKLHHRSTEGADKKRGKTRQRGRNKQPEERERAIITFEKGEGVFPFSLYISFENP